MSFAPGDASPKLVDKGLHAAVEDMNLDARYSPEAVAARLKAIEDEAKGLKQMRRDGDL